MPPWMCKKCYWGNNGDTCEKCGSTKLGNEYNVKEHKTPWKKVLQRAYLRPEFTEDNARPVRYFLDEARKSALEAGNAPIGFNLGLEILESKARGLNLFSVLTERDKNHRKAVFEILAELIKEALVCNYNVENNEVFKNLYSAAVELYSAGYQPMQVLGATVEGIKTIPK